MDKVRIAIVGCGNISNMNVPGYLKHPNCEVYALCDSAPGRVEERAKQWGISPKLYTDFDQVLNDPKIDAVELLMPHHLHLPMTLAALDAGKHVSCQKPMCRSIAEADEMIAAANKAQTKFRVTENFIYYPPILKAKELLDSGIIGEPNLVRFHSTIAGSLEAGRAAFEQDPTANEWRKDPVLNPGGLCWDDGVHKFSTAMKWIGDIEQVSAIVSKDQDFMFEIPSAVIWKFKDRTCLGSYEYSNSPEMTMRAKYYQVDDYMEIHGTKGAIHVTRCTGEMRDLPPILIVKGTETEGIDVPSDWMESFNGAANDFIDSIIEDRTPDISPEFGKKTVQVALAIYEAARTKKAVDPSSMV